MTNPARPAANLPIQNPSPHQLSAGATIEPAPSNGPQVYAEVQAQYLAETLAAFRPVKTPSNNGETE